MEELLQLSSQSIIVDVRSPGEFAHGHVPGGFNLPLFSDEERKVVGTAYKQESREVAIKLGLDYFGLKMRPLVEQMEAMAVTADGVRKPVIVHCWRGGMRSAGVAWLLDLYGFKVSTLVGGYKAFRNWVLHEFEQPIELKVLGGYTGSGKTEVLKKLGEAGSKAIDLEGLACHKGSAFGGINMVQPSQEMFENLLAFALFEVSRDGGAIWVEDESRRIGQLNLPAPLWQAMQVAPVYFLDVPFEQRLEYITQEYGVLPAGELAGAIERIKKRLGGVETKNALSLLAQGDIAGCFRILLGYYDKHYAKGAEEKKQRGIELRHIKSETVDPVANSNMVLRQIEEISFNR